MILAIYILIQVVVVCLFIGAFFTKQEILWALTAVLSGVLMFASFGIKIGQYVFDPATGGYTFELVSNSFPYLMGINFLFFALAVALGLFDYFDKYGISTSKLQR